MDTSTEIYRTSQFEDRLELHRKLTMMTCRRIYFVYQVTVTIDDFVDATMVIGWWARNKYVWGRPTMIESKLKKGGGVSARKIHFEICDVMGRPLLDATTGKVKIIARTYSETRTWFRRVFPESVSQRLQ